MGLAITNLSLQMQLHELIIRFYNRLYNILWHASGRMIAFQYVGYNEVIPPRYYC